jgi:hypothetical protein
MSQLKTIPRVESKAPQKNTIEWEIPNEILASLLLVSGAGYMFVIKVKNNKKHWWESAWKHFSKIAPDPTGALLPGLDFLEKFGYCIDHNSVQFGEKIGEPEYFKKEKQKNDSEDKVENSSDEDTAFFKKRVYNWQIIEENGGTLPILPINIGTISINDKNKTINVEIRQTATKGLKEGDAWYQVPYYGIGHLLCENSEYKQVDTDINGAVFLLFADKDNPNKIKVMANHNRQAIEILCDKASILDFIEKRVGVEEFRDIDTGSKWGKYFAIEKI